MYLHMRLLRSRPYRPFRFYKHCGPSDRKTLHPSTKQLRTLRTEKQNISILANKHVSKQQGFALTSLLRIYSPFTTLDNTHPVR